METALRCLADRTLASADLLRLMDATPVPCGHSVITAKRSGLAGSVGYGYCPSYSRWYWGSKLLLICTCEGTRHRVSAWPTPSCSGNVTKRGGHHQAEADCDIPITQCRYRAGNIPSLWSPEHA